MRIEERGDLLVQYLDDDGPVVSTSNDTSDLIGNAWASNATLIVLPISRLDPEFFDLSSLKAGEITQKVVNYQLKLAIIGDITPFVERSTAFGDYVWESNRGDWIWFYPDVAALEARLDSRRKA